MAEVIGHKVVEVSDKDETSCGNSIRDDRYNKKRVKIVVGEISVPRTPIHGLKK